MKLSFEEDSQTIEIDLTPSGSGNMYRLTIGEKTVNVEVLEAQEGKLDVRIDGRRVTAYVSVENTRRWVTIDGQTVVLTKSSGMRKSAGGHHHAAGELTAPMPGQVRLVNVNEGDSVAKGQTLLLLEAMKMEIRIQAPFDGKVTSLFVKAGQTVEREQMLVTVDHSP